ncbi:hypothetical protein Hypma_008970 [Hypsizygus marmoreus]|uniref:Uncharacterized protein n=1 Tax=Hypsizygus marmoreus TaxID=39966 RepID=A0A369JQ24_HYPMA|nr:hypothetical protein Hypma_008970 [Hypsizygus marmoreus]
MGRPLFSTKLAPAPEPAREETPERYEKWSIWNRFDPDSPDFFQNAERECFIDTEAYRQELEQVEREARLLGSGGSTESLESLESPASSESSESDRGSPMAVGPDDPAVLITEAYPSSVDWEHHFLASGTADTEWRPPRPPFISRVAQNVTPEDASDSHRQVRTNRPRSATASSIPPFLPPSSLRNSTTATEIDAEAPVSPLPQSPSRRRMVNITPINIPVEPSMPSLLSPESPSTPTDNIFSRHMQTMYTPSPPPSVTPRVYHWNTVPLNAPTSPLAARGGAGPLTNPNARMSLARIDIAPSRVRVLNAAV